MSVAVEIVSRHLTALAACDWPTFEDSISADVHLQLIGVTDFEWMPTTIYRHVTQAWDLEVSSVQLTDEGEGVVRAEICLANSQLTKDIEGEYRVTMGRIDAITLTPRSRKTIGV